MKLTLQLPANRANAREHHFATHRRRKAYYQTAYLDLYHQLGAPRQAKNLIDPAIVTATLYVWNIYDDDGATALLKWPLDALVKYGILKDDKRPHCTITGIPRQYIDRKKADVAVRPLNQGPRVELTIEAA